MKHILLLSWKDISHPRAGGAETVIHTYATGLVQQGYHVTQIAPRFFDAKKEEHIDGIEVKRIGTIHSIYFICRIRYLFINRKKYDIIIDHAGGIPLLSPLYIRNRPIIFFTHHLGFKERNDYFQQRIGISALGSLFRRIYISFVIRLYRKKITITVSQGTANTLQKVGFTNIQVIANTTSFPLRTKYIASEQLILTTMGRIVPNKQFDHAIRVVAALKEKGLPYTLYIVGPKQDKKEVARLETLIQTLQLHDVVFFTGKVSQKELLALRDKTRYGLVTSDTEGFGLTILEANKRGVPVLGYDIPGVNEVLISGTNGYLVEKNNWQKIVETIITENQNQYTTLVSSTQDFIVHYPSRSDNIATFTRIIEDVS